MCDLIAAADPVLQVEPIRSTITPRPVAAPPAGRLVIALTGPAGVGKSTLAALLADRLAIDRGPVTRLSFAGPLRDAVQAIFGRRYDTQADKSAPDPYWTPRLGPDWSTGRQILQRFGTEVCRDTIHRDIWALVAERRILADDLRTVIIDDCRFDNEAAMVQRLGGWVIQLNRAGLPPVPAHASERGIRWSLIDAHYSLDDHPAQQVADMLADLCWPSWVDA